MQFLLEIEIIEIDCSVCDTSLQLRHPNRDRSLPHRRFPSLPFWWVRSQFHLFWFSFILRSMEDDPHIFTVVVDGFDDKRQQKTWSILGLTVSIHCTFHPIHICALNRMRSAVLQVSPSRDSFRLQVVHWNHMSYASPTLICERMHHQGLFF